MKQVIENLKQSDNYRKLHTVSTRQKYIISSNKQYINLSSNDYLALSDIELQQEFIKTVDFDTEFLMGTPASRLMTGNISAYQDLENKIAKLLGKETAIVLSSGFMVNTGVLPALTESEDLIIADRFVHASIIDALRLCKCKWTRYRHNDIEHLQQILEKEGKNHKNIYVVTESVFSMDGDSCNLKEIVALKQKYNFKLYLDEAHAFGVKGEGGLGLSQQEGLLSQVDYYVATFGKAIASQGAFISCDKTSGELLINRMRTLIYSTALPKISLLWTNFVIGKLVDFKCKREKLTELSTRLSTLINIGVNNSSHIQPIVIGSSSKAMLLSQELLERGFWVTAIRYPTVAKGVERLRISLNCHLTNEDIDSFCKTLNELLIRHGISLPKQ